MSFMPNPGSLVRFENGEYGIVVAVTPDGSGDKVVPLGTAYSIGRHVMQNYVIAEIVHEPPLESTTGEKP